MSSKLRFNNLKQLVPSMIDNEVEKEHFSFVYAKQKIDCVFSFKQYDYELLVGVHEINFGFVVNITQNKNGDYIAEITEQDYKGFCKALHLSYKKDGFNSNTLLKLLSKKIPIKSSGNKVDYETMSKFVKCRQVDEADKIYFKGWNDHIMDKRIARNFEKTEFYLGKSVADYCQANNISSLWTDKKSERKKYTPPLGKVCF